jgi:hypothetical protein
MNPQLSFRNLPDSTQSPIINNNLQTVANYQAYPIPTYPSLSTHILKNKPLSSYSPLQGNNVTHPSSQLSANSYQTQAKPKFY